MLLPSLVRYGLSTAASPSLETNSSSKLLRNMLTPEALPGLAMSWLVTLDEKYVTTARRRVRQLVSSAVLGTSFT